MSEMTVRVAKTICESLFGPFDGHELDRPSSISAQSMKAARAVIEAMRYPDDAMYVAGERLQPSGVAATAIYMAMIDAARGTGPATA